MSIDNIQTLSDMIFDISKTIKDESYKNLLDSLRVLHDNCPTFGHRVYACLETKYTINEDLETEETSSIVTCFSFIILLNKQISHLLKDDLDTTLKVVMNNNMGRLEFKEIKKFMDAYSKHNKKILDINDRDMVADESFKLCNTTIDYRSIESLDVFWD